MTFTSLSAGLFLTLALVPPAMAQNRSAAPPRRTFEFGPEQFSNDAGAQTGIHLSARLRAGRLPFSLSLQFSDFGTDRTSTYWEPPLGVPGYVIVEGGERSASIGIEFASLARTRGDWRLGLEVGGGVGLRRSTGGTTITDTLGNVLSRMGGNRNLWGPRAEGAVTVDRQFARGIWVGLSLGPSAMLGVGRGEDDKVGVGALVTWGLRARVGF